MLDIRFRVFDSKNGVMWKHGWMLPSGDWHVSNCEKGDLFDIILKKEDACPMQYIGQKDINDNPIYVKDIVMFFDGENVHEGVVEFDTDDGTSSYCIVYDDGNLWDDFSNAEIFDVDSR